MKYLYALAALPLGLGAYLVATKQTITLENGKPIIEKQATVKAKRVADKAKEALKEGAKVVVPAATAAATIAAAPKVEVLKKIIDLAGVKLPSKDN